jgi:hypothetical protein
MTQDNTPREATLKEDATATGTWIIEDKNSDGEGGVFKVIMSGPYAKPRAMRHLERMQRNVD